MQQLEEEPDLDADDAAFIQLKVIMLERIAALDQEHFSDPHTADSKPPARDAIRAGVSTTGYWKRWHDYKQTNPNATVAEWRRSLERSSEKFARRAAKQIKPQMH